jgi:large subunit ribosomal protein L15
MFSLRAAISPARLVMASPLTGKSSTLTSSIKQSCARSIGYLHKGTRVRGLIRDEAEYLKSPKGVPYELSEQNISGLKKYLGQEYQLPDKLLLQILTHKSFAHGQKPFNEKLSVYGQHFLKFRTTLFTIHEGSEEIKLDNLGSEEAKRLISPVVLAEYIRSLHNDVAGSIFWKKRDALITNPSQSGENQIYASTAFAIVGSILLQHGKDKAAKFVDEVLLKESSENSLVAIAKRR